MPTAVLQKRGEVFLKSFVLYFLVLEYQESKFSKSPPSLSREPLNKDKQIISINS